MVFYELIYKIKNIKIKNLTIFILFSMLMVSTIIGVFSVYPAPNNGQVNLQGTEDIIIGMDWFIQNKNLNYTLTLNEIPMRSLQFINGYEKTTPYIKINNYGNFYKSRPNIGYNQEKRNLGELYTEKPYILIDNQIKSQKIIKPNSGDYTKNDLNQMNIDNTLNLIYSNNGLEIWKVQ